VRLRWGSRRSSNWLLCVCLLDPSSRGCSNASSIVFFVALGHALALAKRPLVYGGGNQGIMGVVSGAAAEEGGQVTGIIPYAIHAAGGEKDKCNGVAKSDSVAETLDEKRRGRVRDFIIRHTT
jgi:predicted Rossmann-fold nucleotide-binding protein